MADATIAAYGQILSRIRESVARSDYRTPSAAVPPSQQGPLDELTRLLQEPDVDAGGLAQWVRAQHDAGLLDRIRMLSALVVVATSPRIGNFEEASRLVALQELAVWDRAGDDLETNLAAVDRHRGVIAFLMGRADVALECFARSLERERSAENLGNVLAALLRLGDRDEAIALHQTVLRSFPAEIRDELELLVGSDADLTGLRAQSAPW